MNLKLIADKMTLNCKEVPFFGQCVTASGIKPDPAKVDSIKGWPILTNLTDLLSFLVSVNYLSKFIPELRTLQQLLQSLVKGNTEYIWLAHNTDTFKNIN